MGCILNSLASVSRIDGWVPYIGVRQYNRVKPPTDQAEEQSRRERIPLLCQAVELSQRVLGPLHPSTMKL